MHTESLRNRDFETRMMRERDAMNYCGMGRTLLRKWAKENGAMKKIGRNVRYDKTVIDAAFDNIGVGSGEQCEE